MVGILQFLSGDELPVIQFYWVFSGVLEQHFHIICKFANTRISMQSLSFKLHISDPTDYFGLQNGYKEGLSCIVSEEVYNKLHVDKNSGKDFEFRCTNDIKLTFPLKLKFGFFTGSDLFG